MAIGKQAFYRQIDLPQHEAYELMSRTMADNAVTCDAQEGMSAFLAKTEARMDGQMRRNTQFLDSGTNLARAEPNCVLA